MAESGLEPKSHTNPVVISQTDENLYYRGGGSNQSILEQSDQSNQSHAQIQDRFRAVLMLAVLAVVFLTLVIGVALGADLAAKHKSRLSR